MHLGMGDSSNFKVDCLQYITEINITSPTGIVQLDKNNANLAQKISNELFSLIKMNKDGR